MPTSFCSNLQLRNTISAILEKEFFGKISINHSINQSTILRWYDMYIQAFNSNTPLSSITPPPSFPLNKDYIGHDLPVWIEGDPFKAFNSNKHKYCGPISISAVNNPNASLGKKKKIMIIGQDPMRINQLKDKLVVMSPWGLHSPFAFTKQSRFHNWIICPLLAKGYAIYVTDYYKLFATDLPLSNKNRIADSRNFVSGLANTYGVNFDTILEEEMRAFNPSHVVILGMASFQKNVKTICQRLNITFSQVPHPNARGINHTAYLNLP